MSSPSLRRLRLPMRTRSERRWPVTRPRKAARRRCSGASCSTTRNASSGQGRAFCSSRMSIATTSSAGFRGAAGAPAPGRGEGGMDRKGRCALEGIRDGFATSDAIQTLSPSVRSTGSTVLIPFSLPYLAKAQAELRQFDDARHSIDEAIAAVETTKQPTKGGAKPTFTGWLEKSH
jgi:hypothetical protein